MEFKNFIALMLGSLMCSIFVLDIYVLQIRDFLYKCRKEDRNEKTD